MDSVQALNNLKAICAAFKGTLQEHMALQESLRVLEKLLPVAPEVKKESEK